MNPWRIIRLVKNGKYRRAFVPDHPKANRHGYVLAHRVIAENKLLRLLEDWEIVHHKDENGLNNDPENLQVMSQSEHSKLHGTTGKTEVDLLCSRCHKTFRRERRLITHAKHNHYFCSRPCYLGPKIPLSPVSVESDVAHL